MHAIVPIVSELVDMVFEEHLKSDAYQFKLATTVNALIKHIKHQEGEGSLYVRSCLPEACIWTLF